MIQVTLIVGKNKTSNNNTLEISPLQRTIFIVQVLLVPLTGTGDTTCTFENNFGQQVQTESRKPKKLSL